MSLIALELEDNRIFAAVARVSGRRVQIQNLFSFEIEGSDKNVGDQLKEQLAKHRISRGDAIVVVSRGSAEVRLVDVPPAPDNELPDIVRFIARNEFASLNDNWMLDFVRLSGDGASTGHVLAAGVSPEMSNQIKSIAEHAGLRLKHVVLRPFAAVDFVRDRIRDDLVHLLIDFNHHQVDLTIVDGAKVVATRTIRLTSSGAATDKLVPEIRRTIASSSKALAGKTVNEVVLFGSADDHNHLAEKLQARLEADVQIVDPLKHANVSGKVDCDDPSRYIALMGALQSQSRRQKPEIDFLNPKKMETNKGDYSKYLLYGGLAVAGLLMLASVGWWSLRNQQQQIDEMRGNLVAIQDQNNGNAGMPSVEKTLAEVGKVDQWYVESVNWHEQLLDYSNLSLTADDTIVDSFNGNGPTSRSQAKIDVNARATNLPTEKELINSLSEVYSVRPERTSGLNDDKDYPINSILDLKFDPPKKKLAKVDSLATALFMKQKADRLEAAKKRQLKQQDGGKETDEMLGKTSEDEEKSKP